MCTGPSPSRAENTDPLVAGVPEELAVSDLEMLSIVPKPCNAFVVPLSSISQSTFHFYIIYILLLPDSMLNGLESRVHIDLWVLIAFVGGCLTPTTSIKQCLQIVQAVLIERLMGISAPLSDGLT